MKTITNSFIIHQKSVDYMDDVFGKYVQDQHFERYIQNPIIHLYPTKDTYDQDGNLNGYIDALFMDIHIYDTINMKKYLLKNKDGIFGDNNLTVSQIKAFKDGSTMIVLRGRYELFNGQAIHIMKL